MIIEKRRGGIFKNWSLIDGRIYGDIHNDEKYYNSEPIRTSVVLKIEAETTNSIYALDLSSQITDEKRFIGKGEI